MGTPHNSKDFRAMRSICLWLHDCLCYNCKQYANNLHVHHLNHKNTDNRLENLMPLCKNCHQIYHLVPTYRLIHAKDIVILLLRKVVFYSRLQ